MQTFFTKRLKVIRIDVIPNNSSDVKATFVAYRTDDDTPYPVVVATLDFFDLRKPYLWMIETNYQHKREGLATELWEGIERACKCQINAVGVTKAGRGLVNKMMRD